ncbi:MAG: ATP-binding protein, partial [Planctomycetota bacterium]
SSGEALEKVAGLAREMRESLADIVWSVDPRRDRVGDLVSRLRQVGNQLVEAGGIEFSLTVESDRPIESLPIAPSERRGLFLIAKESMHNAVKHAQASRIDVELRVQGSSLSIAVRDDGRGFDPEAIHAGHGLRSLRSRATSLGAQLGLRSGSGSGTQVDLALQLRGGPA